MITHSAPDKDGIYKISWNREPIGNAVKLVRSQDGFQFFSTDFQIKLVAKTMKLLKEQIGRQSTLEPKPKNREITIDEAKRICGLGLSHTAVHVKTKELRKLYPHLSPTKYGAIIVRMHMELCTEYEWARRWLAENPETGLYTPVDWDLYNSTGKVRYLTTQ